MRTRIRNTPVPAGPRAPVDLHWLWYVGPPAGLTLAYRQIPPRVRQKWSLRGTSTSHLALAVILAGYGWRAFFAFAWPFRGGVVDWWKGGPLNFPAWVSPHMGLGWNELWRDEHPVSILDRGGKKGWYVNG